MRLRLIALLAALAALLVVAVPAQAIDAPALRAKLARELRYAGPASGALVRDLATGRTLFAGLPDVGRKPASVEKLYTTATALMRFGPAATLQTAVLGSGAADATGVWRGDLYVRGEGDPTLSADDLRTLARDVADRGIIRVDGSVRGDESLFDARRGPFGPFDREVGGVLSAVSVGRGWSRDGAPAAEAARRLAKALRAEGVGVEGRSMTGIAPPDTEPLAAAQSPPMADLARLINVPSDNFMAEMLLKALGARFRGVGSTLNGQAVIREQLAAFGLRPRIADGSGLSYANRTTPREVVGLLDRIRGEADVATAFDGSLAVAGRTGTIRRRMRGTPAQDNCRAKTGTLRATSALAGYCEAAGGHTIAFALLMERVAIWRAHGAQDRMTAAIARYDGA